MTAFGWALVSACVWGMVPMIEKAGLAQNSPNAAVVVRSLGVVIGLIAFSVVQSPWAALQGMRGRSALLLALAGFLASFVGQLMFYRALRVGEVSQVTPVAGAYPLVAAVLGWLLLRESFTPARLLGVAFIVAGVALLRR